MMKIYNVTAGLVLVILFNLCSANPTTLSLSSTATITPSPENEDLRTNFTSDLSESRSLTDFIPEIAEKFTSARSFIGSGVYVPITYLDVLITLNFILIIGILVWHIIPQTRFCTLLNNCSANNDRLHTVARNLQDPEFLQSAKRSFEKFGPILRAVSEGQKMYESAE